MATSPNPVPARNSKAAAHLRAAAYMYSYLESAVYSGQPPTVEDLSEVLSRARYLDPILGQQALPFPAGK